LVILIAGIPFRSGKGGKTVGLYRKASSRDVEKYDLKE